MAKWRYRQAAASISGYDALLTSVTVSTCIKKICIMRGYGSEVEDKHPHFTSVLVTWVERLPCLSWYFSRTCGHCLRLFASANPHDRSTCCLWVASYHQNRMPMYCSKILQWSLCKFWTWLPGSRFDLELMTRHKCYSSKWSNQWLFAEYYWEE